MQDDALALIGAAGMLDATDERDLADLSADIQQSFATAQVFRTNTEMRISVLNDVKHPTPDSKYWQAVREQDVHVIELVHLSYEYRKAGLQLRRLTRQLATETDEIECEALVLEIEHQQYTMQIMARQAHHRVREIRSWAAIKEELKPHMRYGTEDVDAHQLEAMRLRWTKEAQLVNQHTAHADARNVLALAEASQKGL